MQTGLLVHSSVFKNIADLAVVFGSSPSKLLEKFDIDFSKLDIPDSYLPIDTYHRVVDECKERFNQPNFSAILGELHVSSLFSGYSSNILSMKNVSAKLKEFSERCAHLLPGVSYRSNVTADTASIELVSEQTLPLSAQIHALSLIDQLICQLTNRSGSIRSWVVSESHEGNYHRPVMVESGRTALHFAPELLSQPVSSAQLKPAKKLTAILAVIREQLNLEDASLESVAARFNVSGRQLQRQLKEAGTTFRNALDAVRFDRARDYLKNPSFKLGLIANYLGYSEDSAFSRSFKRWSGMAPKSWRRMTSDSQSKDS